jgi:heme-degrading monooxygenase HmoA
MKFAPVFAAVASVTAVVPVAAQGTPPSTPVVAVVKVPMPWYAPRALVVSKMRDTVPQYAKQPGLVYKMFSVGQTEKQFGGIYFWKSRSDAQAWFNRAWFERVEKERGAKGDVRMFDALVTLDNTAGGTPAASDSKTVATLVLIAMPQGATRERLLAEFNAAVPAYQKVPGLLRKNFIVSDDGQFGGVYLWADKAAADQWFTAAWFDRVRYTYRNEASVEWFDVPILTPSTLAENKIEGKPPATTILAPPP